jgi:uncharacterized membrane protein
MWSRLRAFLAGPIDTERVEAAIAEAEQRTSGEIRVSIAPFFWGSVRRAAERAFDRLGMRETAQRNGVLIFLVPTRRSFVVLGDEGIHAKVGQDFWDRVRDALEFRLAKHDATGGLVGAISTIGEALSAYFPFDAERDTNELPNAVDFGEAE